MPTMLLFPAVAAGTLGPAGVVIQGLIIVFSSHVSDDCCQLECWCSSRRSRLAGVSVCGVYGKANREPSAKPFAAFTVRPCVCVCVIHVMSYMILSGNKYGSSSGGLCSWLSSLEEFIWTQITRQHHLDCLTLKPWMSYHLKGPKCWEKETS